MTQPDEISLSDLAPNDTDKNVAVIKGVTGIVPWAGAIFGEIISNTIPNQRIDRIAKYLEYLSLKLDSMNILQIQDKIIQTENIDFFEDGAYLAARSLSDKRMKYIANCVAIGIAKDDLDKTREKRVLRLLHSLDDEEITMLYGYWGHSEDAQQVFAKLMPAPASLSSSPEQVNEQSLYEAAKINLEQLGLIETYYSPQQKGKAQEFDNNGRLKGGRKRITWLGRMLLKKIGLIDKEIP